MLGNISGSAKGPDFFSAILEATFTPYFQGV